MQSVRILFNQITRYRHAKWLFLLLASLPVILFHYQYFATGHKLIGGDFDYFAQMYEALRISLLQYGQFPLWNPWMAGGVPLYANPQFGLVSIQSFFVILFGTIYGLKLAYIFYSLAGFWGMYVLCRNLSATKVRSILISYVWVFCGFFAGHNIMHYTFTLFFLLPWLILLIHHRQKKWAWLWLGLLESLIILSSVHYAFLMTGAAIAIYFLLSLSRVALTNKKMSLVLTITKNDILFAVKALAIVIALAGHRFITTYLFVSNNERTLGGIELYPTAEVIFTAIFLPAGSLIDIPPVLAWGWWEYSMYIGIGTGLAFAITTVVLLKKALSKPKLISRDRLKMYLPILLLGLVGLALAFGDFGKLSPYNILQEIPGFSQTRVPSRWLIMTVFAILILLAISKSHTRTINTLLAISVLELFLTFGPPRASGQEQINMPENATYSDVIVQYDNGYKHSDIAHNPHNSYYYATKHNTGHIYADDAMINTLNKVYGSSKCGLNINKECSFVLSENAVTKQWSPNKIILQRTGPGEIVLNMNVEAGWRVNNTYAYFTKKRLDPIDNLTIPDNDISIYTLEYAPKLSPSWVIWKFNNL